MATAKLGDRVRVHYQGRLEDGRVFSSTYAENEPFEFTIGEPNLLPGFNQALVGMAEGDKKTIVVPEENAYGKHKPEFVFCMEKSQVPEGLEVQLGKRLQVRLNQGSTAIVTVTAITDDTVILDANDTLAGKTITFEIELLKIR